MTNLDAQQLRLLQTIAVAKGQVDPALEKLKQEYEQAVFNAKAPVLVAVEAARKAGVPFNRIATEGLDMGYAMKAKQWLSAPDNAAPIQVVTTEAPTVTHGGVVRDPSTGAFRVPFEGKLYEVAAIGPDDEPWSEADPTIPQQVYDMIREHNPRWTLLEEDDE